LEERREHA